MISLTRIAAWCLAATIVTAVSWTSRLAAQTGPGGTVELRVEAIAAGVALTFPAGRVWSVGVDVSAGRLVGVDLTDEGTGLDTYVTGYVVGTWRPEPRWQVSLGPVGVAGVVGNDFGAAYPSAQAAVARFGTRMGVGSAVRVIRIAGGNGSGDYWLQWIPVQVRLRV